ncbi:class I SAM-dependent methyltransferase [bacterium]|nr:class I SAM-dependent methyltransferase [bacterium]
MDKWKFYDITHREHTYLNPMSSAKFEQLIALLKLKPGAKVLDIGSGKGEFLIRLAEKYDIDGLGIDLSPYFVKAAKQRQQVRVPDAKLNFLEMDGADFTPEKPESFDLVSCIGASWIFGGHRGTVQALNNLTAPGGWIVDGEPYWLKEPNEKYLEMIEEKKEMFNTHIGNVETAQESGLKLAYTLVSNHDDWDMYEGLQWYSAEEWAIKHPEDPDVEELLNLVRKQKTAYLKWGRETLGWAIYLFKSD